VRFYFVTPGFFKTMEVPALAGRDFTDRDIVNAPWVAIINEAAAERFWPNEDAVGQHLRLNIVDDEQPREVVGLVGSVPLTRWDMARTPMVYVPQLQLPQRYRVPYGQNRVSMTFLLRAREPDAAVVARVRTAVAEIDPRLPVASFQRVEAYLGDQIEAPRYYMLTLTGLGAIASVLAVTGIYGIVAYAIAQRRREMAIRVALGATGRNVVALVVADAARFAVAGLVLGVGAALVLSGLLRGVLWGVATNDPGTFVAVTLTFCLAILIASLMPMRSLIRLDPRAALNED
jgi:predicted lysophospholipase L1 biosynthesis ABC-type transport system permease subunit